MKKIQDNKKFRNALSIGVTATVIELIKKYASAFAASNEIKINEFLLLIGGFIILFIFIYYFQYRIDRSFNSDQKRRKKILKDSFIEGNWKDVVFTENNENMTGGLVTISYIDDNFVVSGESFDDQGKRIGSFKSSNLVYFDETNNILTFVFGKYDGTSRDFDLQGYSKYDFKSSESNSEPYPDQFDGFYIKRGDSKIYKIYGKKLSFSDKKNIGDNEDRRGKIVKDNIDLYKKNQGLKLL